MSSNPFRIRPALSFALGIAFSIAAAGSAGAADITAANPRIENGKLVVSGTTLQGTTKVRLEGQTASAFNVISNQTTKAFTLSVVYYPSDCVITLQKVNDNNTLGAATNWIVANCGGGVTPRGAWSNSLSYLTDDLVTSGGSTWRAKQNNTNKPPTTNTGIW